jgi:ribosomal protein L37E
MTTGSEQKSVAPNCKRCGQPTHLLTTIPKFDKHPPTAYFNASRAKWWSGSPIYDEADFREAGQDCFRCGSKANPNNHGMTWYLKIIANRRVVSSETTVPNGKRLCASPP